MIYDFKFYIDENYQNKKGKKGDLELGYLDRESFFLAHFLTRYLRSKKIESNSELGNIKHVILYFSSPSNEVIVEHNDTFRCNLSLKYSDVFELRGLERKKWFVRAVKKASNLLENLEPKLSLEIKNAINLFEDSSYRNLWIHSKKRLKGIGVAKLECELTPLYFFLTLVVSNKNNDIYEKKIITTPADSFMYHSLFNKMKVEENELFILDRISEEPIFEIGFDEIHDNKEGKFPPNPMINDVVRFDIKSKELIYYIKTNHKKTKWLDDFREDYLVLDSNKPCPDLY